MSDCINTDHGYPPCPIIAELEAKIERLTSRGIEDMRFTIQKLEAENLKLKTEIGICHRIIKEGADSPELVAYVFDIPSVEGLQSE
jgi:hypothetical protein